MPGLFRDEIDILYTASNKLTQAATPVEQLEAVSDYARSNGASTGVLFHMDSVELELEVVVEWCIGRGVPLGVGSRYKTATLDFTQVWLAQPGRPTLIYDTRTDDRIDPETRDFFTRNQIYGVAVLPLNNKGRWMGVLMFGWSDPYLFDERDLQIFTFTPNERIDPPRKVNLLWVLGRNFCRKKVINSGWIFVIDGPPKVITVAFEYT